MNKWIVACRLRTLPLSSSAVILGLIYAFVLDFTPADAFHLLAAFLVIATAVLLQILSNYANDYGDQISGVDKGERLGRVSMVQLGQMSMADLKKGMILLGAMTLLTGLAAVGMCWYHALMAASYGGFGLFIVLGALAVVAALTYTIGPSYSYIGLGDLFVFIFFGLVAVIGAEFLMAHTVSWPGVLMGISAGCSSIMVLNVNNLRDYESDIVGGKRSVVVRFGLAWGRGYHLCLFLLATACAIGAVCLSYGLWCLSILPLCLMQAWTVWYIVVQKHQGSDLECMMKFTSLGASIVNLGVGAVALINHFL